MECWANSIGGHRCEGTSPSARPVCLVDKPTFTSIHVALNCIRYCAVDIAFWPPKTPPLGKMPAAYIAPKTEWTGRLWPQSSHRVVLMLRRGIYGTVRVTLVVDLLDCTATPSLGRGATLLFYCLLAIVWNQLPISHCICSLIKLL